MIEHVLVGVLLLRDLSVDTKVISAANQVFAVQ